MEQNSLQHTPEWYSARLFRFTSSDLNELLSDPRSKDDKEAGNPSESSKTYIYDKVSEYITNGTILDYKDIGSKAVRWGEEQEFNARIAYEFQTGRQVEDCGFFPYEDYFGGSPDGLVGDDGFIEIKCPYSGAVHVRYLLLETPQDLRREKPEYYAQIQGNFIATGRKWCDFISYDPRVQNPNLVLKVLRLEPDEEFIELCKKKLIAANAYKREVMDKLFKLIA